jgi:hypothetical protein
MPPKTNPLTPQILAELSSVDESPCLSLYQRTHRHHPDNLQDPIRFGNLLKKLEISLLQAYEAEVIGRLLSPFRELADDKNFWRSNFDGLAVLVGEAHCYVFRLQRPLPDLAIVADSFHLKPLRRFLQSVDRYQVLGLSSQVVRLFEGNRDALDEIDLAPEVPKTLTEALGEDLTSPRLTVSSYGGVGGGHTPMHHGHGGRKDQLGIDAERFFRVVDRAILAHHSKPSGLPLILVALPEHHHLFRQISHNPFLLEEGLGVDPGSVTLDDLRQRTWGLLEPQYRRRLKVMAEYFGEAQSKDLGSDDLEIVAQAASAGRVSTLLLESGRQISGILNADTGQVALADLNHPWVDDLLDDLGELVVGRGGSVMVLPSDLMPVGSGLAATFRY